MKQAPFIIGLAFFVVASSSVSAAQRAKSPLRAWSKSAFVAAALPFLGHSQAPATEDVRPLWARAAYADTKAVREFDAFSARRDALQKMLTRLNSAYAPQLAEFSSIDAMRVLVYQKLPNAKEERKRLAKLSDIIREIDSERLKMGGILELADRDAAYALLDLKQPIEQNLKDQELQERIFSRWMQLQIEHKEVADRAEAIDRAQRDRHRASLATVLPAIAVEAPAQAGPPDSTPRLSWADVPPGTVLRSTAADEHGPLIYFKNRFWRAPLGWRPGDVR